MIASAGTGEDELDELQTRLLEMRFGGQRKIMIALARGHPLRSGLTAEQAADTFSALASPELHHFAQGQARMVSPALQPGDRG